jgi:hypothetical protein
MVADHALADVPRPDVIRVPGAVDVRPASTDTRVLDWLRAARGADGRAVRRARHAHQDADARLAARDLGEDAPDERVRDPTHDLMEAITLSDRVMIMSKDSEEYLEDFREIWRTLGEHSPAAGDRRCQGQCQCMRSWMYPTLLSTVV